METTDVELADAIAAQIIASAFTWLRERRTDAVGEEPRDLALDREVLVPEIQWYTVTYCIAVAYGILIEFKLMSTLQKYFRLTPSAWVPRQLPDTPLGQQLKRLVVTASEIARLRHEFTRPYLGGEAVVKQLETYISNCVDMAAIQPLCVPYISIVQSSGFRPSLEGPVAYPAATSHLREYLFPTIGESQDDSQASNPLSKLQHESTLDAEAMIEDQLVEKLFYLYGYAAARWHVVGQEWFQLFDNQDDLEILLHVQSLKLKGSCMSNAPRTLVLAIDEARYLLRSTTKNRTSWFERLRRALRKVAPLIRERFGPNSRIFVVLVDTSSRVMNFAPPVAHDQSSRADSYYDYHGGMKPDDSLLFPPFVLTHTMDIRFKTLAAQGKHGGLSSIQLYQRLVNLPYEEAWSILVSMGRPLWDRVKMDDLDEKEEPRKVIELAASKLLGGLPAIEQASFREESLFGVASVLCRAGIRPHSLSPLASRVIADVMAVLVHTSFDHEQRLSTYSSDPILTFGAAYVWYGAAANRNHHTFLAEKILPEFRKLLRQEVVDTGGVGELVSRIVLLLAMGDVHNRSCSSPSVGY